MAFLNYGGKEYAINANAVQGMIDTIGTYRENATDAINEITTWEASNLQSGFFGGNEAGRVKGYLARTVEEIGDIITYFEDFEKALEDVYADYVKKDKEGDISTVTEYEKEEEAITVNRFKK